MRSRLVDADARERAATDLDTSFLVEAPAGSGKTTLLVARILAWIRSGRAILPGIVAITFTEKAAADLRLRVREAIERARPHALDTERPHLDQALADLEIAPIRTIHAFCADLIRERPVEAGVDPGFAVADPFATQLLLDETWERWLERMIAGAPAALEDAVALGVTIDALRDLAYALVAERDLLGGLPAPVPEAFASLTREVRARLVDLAEAAPPPARTSDDRMVGYLDELAAWVRQTESLAEAEQITALVTELTLRSPATLGTQRAWGRERLAAVRAELGDIAAQIGEARLLRLHNLAATLARWLVEFVDAYRMRMRRLGLLDFHDLLAVARDLLRDRPDVRGGFQQRYRTILVDEFQDTDPLQLEIAFFLAEDPGTAPAESWETVRLGSGRLFLVGDPKQSIYRFRRADIETYERAREVLAAQGAVLELATNFRSVARLLDAVNHLFARQMQPPEDGHYQPPYASVARAPETEEGEGPLLLEWPPDAADAPDTGTPPTTLEERRAREAAALAALLERAVTTGSFSVRDRHTRAPRPGGYRDIVCLLRTLTHAAVYEDAFRAAGVPYRTVGGRHYYERSEVGWALAVLAAIEDPHDGVALVGALRSPFFGVPDDALLRHAARGGRFSYLGPLPPDPHPALRDAWAILRELHTRRVHESPTAIVEALYAETEVLAAYALDPQGDQRVANLLRILDTARALEAAGRPTFRALVGWLRAQGTGRAEESESIVAEEGDEVVRLMTVHAAKGLEFPIVVLPDLGWHRDLGTPRLLVGRRPDGATLGVSLGKVGDWDVETRNFAELKEREARRADAELLRLFYVATTRARDHLVLPLLFGLLPRGFAAFCAPLFDEAAEGMRRLIVDSTRPAPPPEASSAAPTLTPRETWAAARAAALARGRETGPLLHPGGGPTRSEGARLGALVHAALGLAVLGRADAAPAAVSAAATRLGEAGERLTAAEGLVAAALASPPYRRAARSRRALRERPVAAVVDGQLVEGIVDLVFEEATGLVVVEVKLAPVDAGADVQLGAYCRALAATGHRVAEACILVLTPEGTEVMPVSVTFPRER